MNMQQQKKQWKHYYLKQQKKFKEKELKKKKKKKKVSWKQKTNYYCLQVFNDIWTPLAPPRKYWFLFSWDRSLPIVISRIPTKLFWILIKFSDCLPNTFQQRRSLCG